MKILDEFHAEITVKFHIKVFDHGFRVLGEHADWVFLPKLSYVLSCHPEETGLEQAAR